MSPPALTAEAQLRRILWLIPAATRPGGILLDEAARELGVTRRELKKDVDALTERMYYHPAGTAEGLSVEVTDGRLEIFTTGQFGRPPRLTPREVAAVVLGLRLAAADHAERVARLEKELAFAGAGGAGAHRASAHGAGSDTGAADPGPPDPADTMELADLARGWSADELVDTVREAWRGRQCCVFEYLKAGDGAPATRRLHCFGLIHAEGRWYATGLDPEAGEPRNFRVDRMLSARLEGEPGAYEIPEDFDPASVLEGGARVFVPGSGARADDAPALVVRYAPEVGPWARERWDGEDDHDGWYTVRHPLADPDWAIRHVLEYGAHAELVEPAELRDAVRSVAARMAAPG